MTSAVIIGYIDAETMERRMEQTRKHDMWMRKKWKESKHPGNYLERVEKRGTN